MERRKDCKIVLETGEVFEGYSLGAKRERVCELVFNTNMVGYQEVISDPSSCNQAVVMTYPIIGNYGITDEDFENKSPTVGSLIMRDYNDLPSNFRCTKTLAEVLEDNDVPAMYGPDTREITRLIKEKGVCKVIITDISTPIEECLAKIKETVFPENAVATVSCRKKWYCRTEHSRYKVVAVDLGIKQSFVKQLCARGCNVTVVPYNVTAEEIERLAPDGVFISNGPGNPEAVDAPVELIKSIRGKYPIFGICMGHQLIARSYGAKTYKMKNGHRGGNYPVRNVETGAVEISGQNHGYAVDEKSLEGTPLKVTHLNVLDGTVEGVECKADRIYGIQYYSESCPERRDGTSLLDKFISMMEESKNA